MKESKDKIICLVGESGSGKTTIAELLEGERYNYIESYTTRPKRYEGERGHIFVNCEGMENLSGERLDDFINSNEVIAYTCYNNNHYWAERKQYKDKGTSIYVIDVPGIRKLKEMVIDAEIVVIYLRCETLNRASRMYNRQGSYDGIYERLAYDEEAFKIIECDYCIDANENIEETLNLVKQVIKGVE